MNRFDVNKQLLIDRIRNTPFKTDPWPFLDLESVFDETFLKIIMGQIPEDKFFEPGFVYANAYSKDGSSPRSCFKLNKCLRNSFWGSFSNIFDDEVKNIIKERLNIESPVDSVLEIIRDKTDFWIEPHCDAPGKVATLMIYLPNKNCEFTFGTSFYNEKFEERYRIPYTPGRAFVFKRTDTSWHGIHKITKPNVIRDSIMFMLHKKW